MEYLNLHSAVSKAYQSVTGPPPPPFPPGVQPAATGIAGGMIALIVIIALAEVGFGIWAVVALIKFWKALPLPAAILSLLLILFGFPIFSLPVTYYAKR